jgi:hypothetical protein
MRRDAARPRTLHARIGRGGGRGGTADWLDVTRGWASAVGFNWWLCTLSVPYG